MAKYNYRMATDVKVALAPVSADAAAHEVVGEIIDLDGANSCEFHLILGTLAAGGSITWKIYHDDAAAMGTEAEATAAAYNLDQACPAVADTDDKTVKSVSYIGQKRYVRMKITTVGAFAKEYAGVAILGHPRNNTSAPPDPSP